MHIVDLFALKLPEGWYDHDPTVRNRGDFALWGGHGAEGLALVYFELEPGHRLGRHTDSAEEVLLVLDGEVEASVGEEQAHLSRGAAAVVPELVPHDVSNVGASTARVVGFFPRPAVVATFEAPMQPFGERVFSTPDEATNGGHASA